MIPTPDLDRIAVNGLLRYTDCHSTSSLHLLEVLDTLGRAGRGLSPGRTEDSTMRKLDWKWIVIGVLIMVALNFAAGFFQDFVLRPEVQGATNVSNVSPSGGQVARMVVINFLIYVIGGVIVGIKSAGRTILEPGISAVIAVVIGLLFAGNLTMVNVLAGGLIPLVAGVSGGWLGERRSRPAKQS